MSSSSARALSEWVRAVSAAISSEDGASLAFFLRGSPPALDGGPPAASASASSALLATFSPAHDATKSWYDCLRAHLCGGAAVRRGDAKGGFDGAHDALSALVEAFKSSASNWLIGALHALVRGACAAERALDGSLRAAGSREGAPAETSKLVRTLQSAFAAAMQHRLPRDAPQSASKKCGALAVANAVFGIYFRTNLLRQCKHFVSSIETPGFPPMANFPRAQVVAYNYYTGVLSACEDKHGAALDRLNEALRDCHREAAVNLRLILRMLVPVSLLVAGRVPPRALLLRHGLEDMFAGLVDAFRTGDIRL